MGFNTVREMEAVVDAHQKYPLQMSPRDIWRSLSREEQIESAKAYLESGNAKPTVFDRLSRQLRFRLVSLRRQSVSWQAEKLAQHIVGESLSEFIPDLLRSLHLVARKDMLVRFLDGAGIPNTDGVIDDDVPPPTSDALGAGLAAILPAYPPFHILTYFRTLVALDSSEVLWSNLPAIAAKVTEAIEALEQPQSAPSPLAAHDSAEEEQPESSEEFTSLDNLLIKTIVASALEIEGSPERAQIDDITDELLHLNADRKRSFFHRGFFEAVAGSEIRITHAGENSESRLWYVAGVIMGFVRRHDPSGCAKLIGDSPALLDELCRDTNAFRVRMLLPVVYPIFRDAGFREAAASYLKHGLPRLDPGKRARLGRQILEDASDLIRDSEAGDALRLLETLPEPSGDDLSAAAFARRLVRKKAQCLQSLGQGPAAELRLKALSELGDFDESIEALADLGLLAGGFSILYGIVPGRTVEEQRSLATALERGRAFFEQAIERDREGDGTRSRNAHFALGVVYAVAETSDSARAAQHLNVALSGMLKDSHFYERGNLVVWARFLFGLSLLETCDETRLRTAAGLIRAALQSEVAFPLSLWTRCLTATTVFDDKSLACEICEELLKRRGSEIFDLIRQSGVLERSRELRSRYADWIATATRAVPALADDWELILRSSLADNQYDLAETALDQLEGLAHTWDGYVDRFLALLADATNYSPAWQPSEAEESIVRLLESQGQFGEASEHLQRQFWKVRAEQSREARSELEGILQRLREWNRPDAEIEMLHLPAVIEAAAAEMDEAGSIENALREGATISILFVGGDERQARHDESVASGLADKYPAIKVEFEHPGWGSNWAPVANQIEASLRDYHALVLSNLVRTNMGRRMRKMCDAETPWFACSGTGPGMITESIVRAAIQVVRLRKVPKI